MKRVSALYRCFAAAAFLMPVVAAITVVLLTSGEWASTALAREQASDYAPIEHFMGGPKRIILMRHADKTDDPDDEDLSDVGHARAEHLATYIPQTFGKPDFIIATAHSKHSDRPRETVQPLADALGMDVQHDFENRDFADLVQEIFDDPDYKGKTLVICWHHGNLPAIATLLGAPAGSYPDPWPDRRVQPRPRFAIRSELGQTTDGQSRHRTVLKICEIIAKSSRFDENACTTITGAACAMNAMRE